MIPKIAHWIWLYEEPPAWAWKNIVSFQKLHYDWNFEIWTEPPKNFPSDLLSLMNRLPHYASRSDIFRYWLMNEYGGVYLDCDNFALRNFDSLLNVPFFTAECMPNPHTEWQVACGLLGSEPKSIASQMILEEVRKRSSIKETKRVTFGPDLMNELFLEKRTSKICKLYPTHYFYLFRNQQTANEYCNGDKLVREEMLRYHADKIGDNEDPFSVHLWGVDGSSFRQIT